MKQITHQEAFLALKKIENKRMDLNPLEVVIMGESNFGIQLAAVSVYEEMIRENGVLTELLHRLIDVHVKDEGFTWRNRGNGDVQIYQIEDEYERDLIIKTIKEMFAKEEGNK
jgi:hypothetical protein